MTPVGVTGDDVLPSAGQEVEGESRVGILVTVLDRQSQFGEFEDEPPFRGLGLAERDERVRIVVTRTGARQPAGLAQLRITRPLHQPVALRHLDVRAPFDEDTVDLGTPLVVEHLDGAGLEPEPSALLQFRQRLFSKERRWPQFKQMKSRISITLPVLGNLGAVHVLRTILRPGWIALGVVVVAFAVACFTLLAPWQLGKNSDTEHRNDLIRTATSLETVPLAEVAPSSTLDPSTEWRQVAVTGRYLEDRQALVRLRNIQERPAVLVLTPFAVTGSDRVILINRGFVRPVEGSVPAIPSPPVGEQTVQGRIRAAESVSADRGSRADNGVLTVPSINPPGLVGDRDVDADGRLLSPALPGSAGLAGRDPRSPPARHRPPYLSYGLQWLAFGIMAPPSVSCTS